MLPVFPAVLAYLFINALGQTKKHRLYRKLGVKGARNQQRRRPKRFKRR